MSVVTVNKIGGLNTKTNPLEIAPGEMIRAVNVDTYHFDAKKKRAGLDSFLPDDNVLSGTVNELFSWTRDDGSTSFLYAVANNKVHYWDVNGTATSWTVCGNGTINNTSLGYAVLENTLMVGDGMGSTRHTTNGTSFTNTSLAPIASSFTDYQNRIYAVGTASDLFYSTTGDATNWSTTGTADSSSIHIPGAGKLNSVIKVSDRILTNKNTGIQHRWDGYNLYDCCTQLGWTSPKSVDQTDGYFFGLNRMGLFGYNGDKPEILSNKVEKLIYNDRNGGINGLLFNTCAGAVHRFDYYLSVGTITEDLTGQTITNALIKYNYQTDEYTTFQMPTMPTALCSYVDKNGYKQFIYGDSNANLYKFNPDSTSDNGSPIYAEMEFLFHSGTLQQKKWNYFRALFNPGCQAKVQIAVEDTFNKASKNWIDLGDVTTGIAEYRFPADYRRGRFLFMRIYEASKTARFDFYGYEVDADLVKAP